jgi:AAA domain, putative AbiEii toxin, Type IV TA system/AAA domain
MILTSLRVSHLRAFHKAEFKFSPGMNLLVGINGVGKSTALDALRVLLSHVMPKISATRGKKLPFELNDIQVGADALTAELSFDFGGLPFIYEAHKPRERYVPNPDWKGGVHEQAIATPEHYELKPNLRKVAKELRTTAEHPLAVYFSPRRSIPTMKKPSAQSIAGGRAAGFADALKHRELRLREFALWWLGRERLAQEPGKDALLVPLDSLRAAVHKFLDGCENLRAVEEPEPTLLLDKEGATFDVRQLSDGERGVLAFILDLARRLALVNPDLDDPTRKGRAIVLIDELDLHLHPKWQRTIVHRLKEAFPNCQFVATTHSPQIISEVEPDELTLLYRDGDHVTVRPAQQAYGLDSNWILEDLMGVPARPRPAQEKIDEVEQALEENALDVARRKLGELRQMLHGVDPDVTRLEASIETLEALTDETDSEEP